MEDRHSKPVAGNPLRRLEAFGQSVWLDFIRRAWLQDGSIARWIAEDGLCGITSNPAIFEKAIGEHHDYDEAIALLARRGASAAEIRETLAVEDVVAAADLLQPVYAHTGGRDGYVSLEVSPHLAHDCSGSVAEARRLWSRVDRPNLMIKVPATGAGLATIRHLIEDGINVNVTLLFGLARYREAAQAYMEGLEARLARGRPVDGLASVASFFLSRIDVLVDRLLDGSGNAAARALRGEAAIACARLAYQEYKALVGGARWQSLLRHGARTQRVLWASTGTKDPAYSDTKYVEPLIGPGTVSTFPPGTLAAYRDHGEPAARLEEGLDEARMLPRRLAAVGIDLQVVAERLEEEGLQKFIEPYDSLLAALERRLDAPGGARSAVP